MRLWHRELLPYLPDFQFKGQLRELVAIMRDVRDIGTPNHILVNRVTEYPRHDLVIYFVEYELEYHKRYGKWLTTQWKEFKEFDDEIDGGLFDGWHNRKYLRVCMANLYEKHFFGIGKSRITDEEWSKLCEGYEKITGEPYAI